MDKLQIGENQTCYAEIQKISTSTSCCQEDCINRQTRRSGWLAIRLMWKTSPLLCVMLIFRGAGRGGRQRKRKTRIEESSKEGHLSPWDMNLVHSGLCFGKALGNRVLKSYLHCLTIPLILYSCTLISCMRRKSHRRSYPFRHSTYVDYVLPMWRQHLGVGVENEQLSLPDWGHCWISKYTHE